MCSDPTTTRLIGAGAERTIVRKKKNCLFYLIESMNVKRFELHDQQIIIGLVRDAVRSIRSDDVFRRMN